MVAAKALSAAPSASGGSDQNSKGVLPHAGGPIHPCRLDDVLRDGEQPGVENDGEEGGPLPDVGQGDGGAHGALVGHDEGGVPTTVAMDLGLGDGPPHPRRRPGLGVGVQVDHDVLTHPRVEVVADHQHVEVFVDRALFLNVLIEDVNGSDWEAVTAASEAGPRSSSVSRTSMPRVTRPTMSPNGIAPSR